MSEVAYRYRVGERVRLLRGERNLGICVVEKLMPPVGMQPMYQVRSEIEHFSRIVYEADLFPLPAEQQG